VKCTGREHFPAGRLRIRGFKARRRSSPSGLGPSDMSSVRPERQGIIGKTKRLISKCHGLRGLTAHKDLALIFGCFHTFKWAVTALLLGALKAPV
jgi:hypothetical protein